MSDAAILFEPDGYVTGGTRLMGRQSAGAGFLRAAVAGRSGQSMWAYTPKRRSAEIFEHLVKEIDPAPEPRWIPAHRHDLLEERGTLYLPMPELAGPARFRLRAGVAAYSLAGVTHTTATRTVMDAITDLLSAPVMPWDALICTSRAVAGTVKALLKAQGDYLRWRFGGALEFTLPQLPVIPLGVHCADFAFSPEERMAAREALGIAADEVLALFVGRLSLHAKAHPHAMYASLEEATRASGSRIVLLQCGWFGNAAVEKAFKSGQAQFSPSVRAIWSDGRDNAALRQAWAAGDFFMSLSDSIQETFGLTPIEAMAAGLPAIVTDWDGYKDTVRDGLDGFRVPTLMPPPPLGIGYARGFEAGSSDYDHYCALTSRVVSIDFATLGQRLHEILRSPELRRSLGETGRQRAREEFDWAVIMRRYRTLWDELARIRAAARGDEAATTRAKAAPREYPSRMDPFRTFGHYATARIEPGTLLALAAGASTAAYRELAAYPVFGLKAPSEDEVVEHIFRALEGGPRDIKGIAEFAGIPLGRVILAAAALAKMGQLVKINPAP